MLQSVPVHRSGVIGTSTTATVRLGDVPTVHGHQHNISFPHLNLHSLPVFLLYLSPDDHVGPPLLQRMQLIKYSHCTYFVIRLQLENCFIAVIEYTLTAITLTYFSRRFVSNNQRYKLLV